MNNNFHELIVVDLYERFYFIYIFSPIERNKVCITYDINLSSSFPKRKTPLKGRAAPNLRTRHKNYFEAAHIFYVIMIKVKPFIYDKSFLQALFFIMRLNRGVVLPFHVKKISLRYNILGFCMKTLLSEMKRLGCFILQSLRHCSFYTPNDHLSNSRTYSKTVCAMLVLL